MPGQYENERHETANILTVIRRTPLYKYYRITKKPS